MLQGLNSKYLHLSGVNKMENKTIITASLISLLFILTGCDFLGTIFKTGMGVGVIIAVIIVALGIYLFRKMRIK